MEILTRLLSQRWLHHLGAVLLLGMCGSLSACGSNSPEPDLGRAVFSDSVDGKFVVRPIHWRVSSVAGKRSVNIYSSLGYCKGDRKPRYAKHEVIERDSDFFITLFAAFPRVKASTGSACLGIGWSVDRVIRLPQELTGSRLYDNSLDPPRKRWPRTLSG